MLHESIKEVKNFLSIIPKVTSAVLFRQSTIIVICFLAYLLALVGLVTGWSILLTNFTNVRFLLWAEAFKDSCANYHLPDMFMDYVRLRNETNAFTFLLGLAPKMLIILAVSHMIIFFCPKTFNRFAMTYMFIIILNMIAETLTIYPSALGYYRCLAFNGWSSSLDVEFDWRTNNCSAGVWSGMMWSGHTQTCVVGIIYFLVVISNQGSFSRPGQTQIWVIEKLSPFIGVLIGLTIGSLLILNYWHYTSDIIVAIIYSILIIFHQGLQEFFDFLNPFVPPPPPDQTTMAAEIAPE